MTTVERKLNPRISASLVKVLTEPELNKASGGDFWNDLETIYRVTKCNLGIHDWYFTNTYENWVYMGRQMRAPVYRCRRCTIGKLGPTEVL